MKIKPALLISLIMIGMAAVSQAQTPLSTYLLPTSCRVLDTRATGNPIQSNEIRVFSVEQGFSDLQGGVADCYVPLTAKGIKINIKGRTSTALVGNFRVFNADASALGIYTTLQLRGPAAFDSIQVDIPIGGNLQVSIHSNVESNAVVDLVGWFE